LGAIATVSPAWGNKYYDAETQRHVIRTATAKATVCVFFLLLLLFFLLLLAQQQCDDLFETCLCWLDYLLTE
jgi:hypothetical protein